MPTPFDDLRSKFASAFNHGGGVIECDPTAVYDFSRNVIEMPSNVRVRGNGSIWKSDRVPPGQGTTAFLASASAVDITIEDVEFVGVRSFTITDKSGHYALDVAGGSRIRIVTCSASNMLGLIRCRSLAPEPIEHVTIRDCLVENSYYGVAFSTPVKHGLIGNLYCRNVIRGAVVIGGQNVRLQLTDEHDGIFPRLETVCLIKSQPTAERDYATDGIVADVTAIGTVGLRRLVQVEFQGPPSAKASRIRDVDVTCRVIGSQGACALVGFANFDDGPPFVERRVVGPHEMKRVTVRGLVQSGSPLSDPRCLWKPFYVFDGSVR